MGLFTDWLLREGESNFKPHIIPLSSLPPKFSALPLSQDSLVATIATHANRAAALSAKAHGVTSRKC